MTQTVLNSLTSRKPTVLFLSWICLSTASQPRLSKSKYTASLHIRIYTYTIPIPHIYLHFQSHHPIHHKSGVVKTLMDRKYTLVSTEDDKDREELHIRNALKSCGYPKWIFDKVKHDQYQKRKKTIDTKKRNTVSTGE